ncbi:SDR family oxidoreductase [Halopseudomonas yangmingensis]|uniref:Short-chain dehydrogenase n=1 Tax=Halopseudomonas yangmingensis TaxID=1720063 RepID=A0A1I4NKG5_9GAMM|nr:SDR family oxidoreductase [Halopseudomonas yangmingensis]SFM15988.1 Short-chain dehydrogenase [Halopseudomonas yangmingensis]
MKNTGQRVVITGAGSGLGRELALRYAREGARLALADINDRTGLEILALVEQAGGSGFVQRCDIRDFSQLAALAQRCSEQLGGVDVLINNAGVASGGFFADLSLEDWEWQISINLMGVVKACKAFVPMLLRQGKGQLINIASMAALLQPPGMSNYNVAKAGVVALSESLLAELKPQGISVSVVCPSFFRTNLLESWRGSDDGGKAQVARLFERSPISAADIADIIWRESQAGTFMILPHEAGRESWELKQRDPQAVIQQMIELSIKRQGLSADH